MLFWEDLGVCNYINLSLDPTFKPMTVSTRMNSHNPSTELLCFFIILPIVLIFLQQLCPFCNIQKINIFLSFSFKECRKILHKIQISTETSILLVFKTIVYITLQL